MDQTMAPKRKNCSRSAEKGNPIRRDDAPALSSSSSTSSTPAAEPEATVVLVSPGDEDRDNDGPIYFWQPHEPATGYLSQWYPQPFRDRTDSGKIYATAEHYMMHHKALLFGDSKVAAEILEASSPADVQALGRQVRGFDGAMWGRERESIVTEANWCKFTLPVGIPDAEEGRAKRAQEEVSDDVGQKDVDDRTELRTWVLGTGDSARTTQAHMFRDLLLATGTRELVEASPVDRIWGVGFAAESAESNRHRWGQNLLGQCLMNVREQLRKENEMA